MDGQTLRSCEWKQRDGKKATLPLRSIIQLLWSAPHNPQPHRQHVTISPEHDRRWKQFFAVTAILGVLASYHLGEVIVLKMRAAELEKTVRSQLDWQHRYDVLADSAGEVAVLEAAAREQGGGQ